MVVNRADPVAEAVREQHERSLATRSYGRQPKDHGGMSSDEWCSPPEIADPLFDFWGWADYDPCSNSRSIIKAREVCIERGGLVRPFKEKTYENWPYSKNDVWSAKSISELKAGNVRELVILCMTATSTVWWHNLMYKPRRNPLVLCTKRLLFLGPDGKSVDSSRFEPALIYYGTRHRAFNKAFAAITRWSSWGRA